MPKLIPFDKDGNLLSWTREKAPAQAGVMTYKGYYVGVSYTIEWRDNFEFDAVLKLKSIYRGRSAVHFLFTDVFTKQEYNMFLSAFERVVNEKVIDQGVVSGRWTFIQRGANYSIALAE